MGIVAWVGNLCPAPGHHGGAYWKITTEELGQNNGGALRCDAAGWWNVGLVVGSRLGRPRGSIGTKEAISGAALGG